jgi:hypothetical protein
VSIVLLVAAAALNGSGSSEVVDALGSSAAMWLLVAILAQVGSMGTFGHLQWRVLADSGLVLPRSTSVALAYAGNAVAVTIPFAGTTASAAFTYRQYVRKGASGAMAGWTMAVTGLISTAAFAALIGVGGLANGNPLAAGAGVLSLAFVAIPATCVAVAVRSDAARRRLEQFAVRTLRLTRRVTRLPRRQPDELVADATRQLSAFHLTRRHMAAALSLASLNWLLDALCLWAVLQALDVSLPVRSLAVVYAAAVAAASLGFTPAGIGTVEAAIAVALTNLGSDGAHALPAAFVYRAISTWLVLLVGWGIFVSVRRGVRRQPPGHDSGSGVAAGSLDVEAA